MARKKDPFIEYAMQQAVKKLEPRPPKPIDKERLKYLRAYASQFSTRKK